MSNNTKKLLAKEKEAEVESPQPPRDLTNRAATQTTQGESISDAAALQEKMKEAAKEFADLIGDFMVSKYESKTGDLSYLARASKVFGPRVYCTPAAVLFRLDGEWVRLTTEHVAAEAFGSLSCATKYADHYLTLARTVCKERGQVGWVLPRINKEKGGALV